MLRVSNVGFDGGTTMCETTTVESCEECGTRFRWDPTMYRLCDGCLLKAERAATPGPRFPFSDSTKAPKARKVAEAGNPGYDGFAAESEGEAVANARLIAAAPDLLAALTDLVELHHDWEPGGRALKSLVVSNDKFIAAARAAIARATAGGVK